MECYYCHKKGHFKKSCKKIKADQKEEKNPENTTTIGVATENNVKLLSVSLGNEISDLWILDLGCSFHMCANENWFDTYEKKNGGEFLMGNDPTCKVVGIETVKVKMYDNIIRTFDNVQHIPSLKMNLISLSTLNANGDTYSSSGGKFKICKGSMVIMRGKMLPNSLYKPLEDIISNGVAIIHTGELRE